MTERIRGRKLQQRRERFFRLHPLCTRCEAQCRTTVATQLDHVVALVNGGTDTWNNLQGLCDACHDAKTREDLGHKASGACDRDGLPIDPDHHWNKGSE